MGSDAPADSRPDLFGTMLDALADSWEHAASMVQRVLAGTYGTDDAFADVALCSSRAAQASVATIAGAMSMFRPETARRNPSSVSMTIPVPDVAQTQAGEFRGIGWGNQFVIRASDVTVQPTPGTPNEVTLTVRFDHVSVTELERTVIYEGHLLGAAGAPVTDTIRVPKPPQLPGGREGLEKVVVPA